LNPARASCTTFIRAGTTAVKLARAKAEPSVRAHAIVRTVPDSDRGRGVVDQQVEGRRDLDHRRVRGPSQTGVMSVTRHSTSPASYASRLRTRIRGEVGEAEDMDRGVGVDRIRPDPRVAVTDVPGRLDRRGSRHEETPAS
jgi:hypothetical protein